MKLTSLLFPAAIAFIGSSNAAVVLTAGIAAPTVGASDQFDLMTDATVPGGTTPSGATYNSQAFSDNSGPPGQTFTTGSGSAAGYNLTGFSFKGAVGNTSNYGNMSLTTTWGIRVSSVSGTTLIPLATVTGISHPFGTAAGDSWYTWTFTGANLLTLAPSTTYAFEAYSSDGFLGFDAAIDPSSYPSGFAFNTTSAVRSFNNATLQDRGYDRTFVANLQAVPEPSALFLAAGGLALTACRRKR